VQGQPDRLKLVLPTVDGRPVPSSEAAEEAQLTPIEFDAVKLAPVDAMFHLLTMDPDEQMSDDLRYWRTAARFTLELLARERYVPSIDERNTANWQPVLTGSDRNRFVRLARAIPPVCRAVSSNGSSPPGANGSAPSGTA